MHREREREKKKNERQAEEKQFLLPQSEGDQISETERISVVKPRSNSEHTDPHLSSACPCRGAGHFAHLPLMENI